MKIELNQFCHFLTIRIPPENFSIEDIPEDMHTASINPLRKNLFLWIRLCDGRMLPYIANGRKIHLKNINTVNSRFELVFDICSKAIKKFETPPVSSLSLTIDENGYVENWEKFYQEIFI